MNRTVLLVASIMLATAASAHQDHILSVHADGTLPELPPAYQTSRLHIAFSDGDAGTLQQLKFISSGRETTVQPCLLSLVLNGALRRLRVSASWYHNESATLPHYVQVQFRDERPPQGLPDHPSIRFLFSLRDAKLLEVYRVVPIGPNTTQDQRINLSNGCPA
jgi:hypothetical protein